MVPIRLHLLLTLAAEALGAVGLWVALTVALALLADGVAAANPPARWGLGELGPVLMVAAIVAGFAWGSKLARRLMLRMPAVKYTVFASPPLPPLPTFSAHSPSIWIGSPSGSFSSPRVSRSWR